MGIFWGLLVALGYATMNLCLRAAALQIDPLVASLVRGLPMVLFAWGALVASGHVFQLRLLGWPALSSLMVVAVFASVLGNAGFQSGLTYAGLTITVPVAAGASVWGGAFGGWWLMQERLSSKTIGGLVLLVVALPLLVSGGGGGLGPVWLGTVAATIAGLSYGAGNVLLRRTVVTHALAQGPTLAVVSTTGIVMFAALVLGGQGPSVLTELDQTVVLWLLVAGVFNAIAFISLSRALALLPVSEVGALGALQTALSALGGMLLFAEPLTLSLAAGLGLSLLGVMLSQRGAAQRSAADETETVATDRAS